MSNEELTFMAMHYYDFYNTLDLDFEDNTFFNNVKPCSKERKDRIKWKIASCKNCLEMFITPSSKKGYHIKFYCAVQCDICRMVFDDAIRFNQDQNRKPQFQNLMFDKKEGF